MATSSSYHRSSAATRRDPASRRPAFVMGDTTRLLGHEMAERLHQGEVSSRELTLAHLEAAERQNHALNAWLLIDRDGALAQADAADARLAAARGEGRE